MPQLSDPNDVSALILAAGEGIRMGGEPKAFFQVGSRSLVEIMIERIREFSSQIIVGLPSENLDEWKHRLQDKQVIPAAGGQTRHDTLKTLVRLASSRLILIHEVARPFASRSCFKRVLEEGCRTGAATLCLPIAHRDSVALKDGMVLGEPLPRERITFLQTPLVFKRGIIKKAIDMSERENWEEMATSNLVAHAGFPVSLVQGDPENIKLTYPEDWELARQRAANLQAKPNRLSFQ